jgi:hypothetical protein
VPVDVRVKKASFDSQSYFLYWNFAFYLQTLKWYLLLCSVSLRYVLLFLSEFLDGTKNITNDYFQVEKEKEDGMENFL